MQQMQKVNVFAEFVDGDTFYRTGLFPKHKTVAEIMQFYGLPIMDVHIYANSKRIYPEKTLTDIKTDAACFLSFIYGERELKKRNKT